MFVTVLSVKEVLDSLVPKIVLFYISKIISCLTLVFSATQNCQVQIYFLKFNYLKITLSLLSMNITRESTVLSLTEIESLFFGKLAS